MPERRREQPADHLDRRRLARAVGPEKREELARAHFQVEPVDGALGSEPLGHAAHCDHDDASRHPVGLRQRRRRRGAASPAGAPAPAARTGTAPLAAG